MVRPLPSEVFFSYLFLVHDGSITSLPLLSLSVLVQTIYPYCFLDYNLRSSMNDDIIVS